MRDYDIGDEMFEDVDPTSLFDEVAIPQDPFQEAIQRVVDQLFQDDGTSDRDYQESVWEAMDFEVDDPLDFDDHFPGPHEFDGDFGLDASELRSWADRQRSQDTSDLELSLPDAPSD